MVSAFSVNAQDVTLRSYDGSISVTGELLEFNGEGYRLKSSIGEVFTNVDTVECVGDGCPAADLAQSDFNISGAANLTNVLMSALLEGFALDQDTDMVIEASADQNRKVRSNKSRR